VKHVCQYKIISQTTHYWWHTNKFSEALIGDANITNLLVV